MAREPEEGYVKEIEALRREKDYFFREDPESPIPQSLRASFTGLAYFPIDPKYRIRAKKIGNQPLTVKAFGSKMSDAIKRSIEVVPDGQMKEQVVNNQLSGKNKHKLTIPDNALPDASTLFVKVYPGVFSQVLEGVEGLIRLPGG